MNNNNKVLSQRIQFASQVYSRMRHNKEFMKHIVLIFFLKKKNLYIQHPNTIKQVITEN